MPRAKKSADQALELIESPAAETSTHEVETDVVKELAVEEVVPKDPLAEYKEQLEGEHEVFDRSVQELKRVRDLHKEIDAEYRNRFDGSEGDSELVLSDEEIIKQLKQREADAERFKLLSGRLAEILAGLKQIKGGSIKSQNYAQLLIRDLDRSAVEAVKELKALKFSGRVVTESIRANHEAAVPERPYEVEYKAATLRRRYLGLGRLINRREIAEVSKEKAEVQKTEAFYRHLDEKRTQVDDEIYGLSTGLDRCVESIYKEQRRIASEFLEEQVEYLSETSPAEAPALDEESLVGFDQLYLDQNFETERSLLYEYNKDSTYYEPLLLEDEAYLAKARELIVEAQSLSFSDRYSLSREDRMKLDEHDRKMQALPEIIQTLIRRVKIRGEVSPHDRYQVFNSFIPNVEDVAKRLALMKRHEQDSAGYFEVVYDEPLEKRFRKLDGKFYKDLQPFIDAYDGRLWQAFAADPSIKEKYGEEALAQAQELLGEMISFQLLRQEPTGGSEDKGCFSGRATQSNALARKLYQLKTPAAVPLAVLSAYREGGDSGTNPFLSHHGEGRYSELYKYAANLSENDLAVVGRNNPAVLEAIELIRSHPDNFDNRYVGGEKKFEPNPVYHQVEHAIARAALGYLTSNSPRERLYGLYFFGHHSKYGEVLGNDFYSAFDERIGTNSGPYRDTEQAFTIVAKEYIYNGKLEMLELVMRRMERGEAGRLDESLAAEILTSLAQQESVSSEKIAALAKYLNKTSEETARAIAFCAALQKAKVFPQRHEFKERINECFVLANDSRLARMVEALVGQGYYFNFNDLEQLQKIKSPEVVAEIIGALAEIRDFKSRPFHADLLVEIEGVVPVKEDFIATCKSIVGFRDRRYEYSFEGSDIVGIKMVMNQRHQLVARAEEVKSILPDFDFNKPNQVKTVKGEGGNKDTQTSVEDPYEIAGADLSADKLIALAREHKQERRVVNELAVMKLAIFARTGKYKELAHLYYEGDFEVEVLVSAMRRVISEGWLVSIVENLDNMPEKLRKALDDELFFHSYHQDLGLPAKSIYLEYARLKKAGNDIALAGFVEKVRATFDSLTSSKAQSPEISKIEGYEELVQGVFPNHASAWTTYENNESCADRTADLEKYKIKDKYIVDLAEGVEMKLRSGVSKDVRGLAEVESSIARVQAEAAAVVFDRVKMFEALDKSLDEALANNNHRDTFKTREEKVYGLVLESLVGRFGPNELQHLLISYEFAQFEDIQTYLAGTRERAGAAKNQDYAYLLELREFFSDRIKEVQRQIAGEAQKNPEIIKIHSEYFAERRRVDAESKHQERVNKMQLEKIGATESFLLQLQKTLSKQGKKGGSKFEAIAGMISGEQRKVAKAFEALADLDIDPSALHLGELDLVEFAKTCEMVERGEYDEELFGRFIVQAFQGVLAGELSFIDGELAKYQPAEEDKRGKKQYKLECFITKNHTAAHARATGGVCVSGDNPKKQGETCQWNMPNYFQMIHRDPETKVCQGLELLHAYEDQGKKVLTVSFNPSSTYLYKVDERQLFRGLLEQLGQFAKENDFDYILTSDHKNIRTNRTGGEFELEMDEQIKRVRRAQEKAGIPTGQAGVFKFSEPQRFSYNPSYQQQGCNIIWEKGAKK